MHSGYLFMTTPQTRAAQGARDKGERRYFVIRKDIVLYVYHDDEVVCAHVLRPQMNAQDSCAVAMLPMPGCRTTTETMADATSTTFKIEHANRTYTLTAESRDSMAK